MIKIKESIKKNIKYILNVLFIILIGWLTFRPLFAGQETSEIVHELKRADKRWLALGMFFVFLFVACESVIIKYMLHLFKEKIPFHWCLKYSFIGFFFSCITPSSSGGQPAQMYYMKKDGIKIGYSSLIMLVIAVVYKAVQVFLGILLFCLKYSFVKEHVGKLMWLLIVGFALNIAYIFLLLFVCFKPLWARKIGIKVVNRLTCWKIVKEKSNEKFVNKITRICDNYIQGTEYMKENIHSVVNITFITLIQRMFLLMVTWIVYKAYGLSGTSFWEIIAIQVMIGIAVEMLPLPGAVGVTEGCFIGMFKAIFTPALVKSAMLLSRGLSFYALLIMSAAVTFAAHILVFRKEKKIKNGEKSDNNTQERIGE